MPSLRAILADHAPVLLLDAASPRVTVGWLAAPEPARWISSSGEAGIELFKNIEVLGKSVNDAAAFLFCEGPGSVLGIRTVAMALRTWNVLKPRPVYTYSSLALVAHAMGRMELGVIADARRDSWHHYQIGSGLRRVATADLAGELATPEDFRHWTPLPSPVSLVPYVLAELWARAAEADLIRATSAPAAFLHEDPNYATWTPQIHRAPAPR